MKLFVAAPSSCGTALVFSGYRNVSDFKPTFKLLQQHYWWGQDYSKHDILISWNLALKCMRVYPKWVKHVVKVGKFSLFAVKIVKVPIQNHFISTLNMTFESYRCLLAPNMKLICQTVVHTRIFHTCIRYIVIIMFLWYSAKSLVSQLKKGVY